MNMGAVGYWALGCRPEQCFGADNSMLAPQFQRSWFRSGQSPEPSAQQASL